MTVFESNKYHSPLEQARSCFILAKYYISLQREIHLWKAKHAEVLALATLSCL